MNNYNDNFTQEDFVLVQSDAKLHDHKLETKPTTFIKDALKRFRKNKSSVFGAIILGILILLAIIVPVLSPSDIKSEHSSEAFLAPKLFKSGTGFWDGSKKYTNIPYDEVNQKPANFRKSAVRDLVINPMQYINKTNEYGKNGFVHFELDTYDQAELYTKQKLSFSKNYNNVINYYIEPENGVSEGEIGEYRIVINLEGIEEPLVLKDWSRDYNEQTLNISEALANQNIETIVSGKVGFDIRRNSGSSKKAYILIKNFIISSNLPDTDAFVNLYNLYSFSDATRMVAKSKDAEGYWQCTGRKGIYKSEFYSCNFTFDTYLDAYNEDVEVNDAKDDLLLFTISELRELRKQSIVSFDENDFEDTFEILFPEKCPFDEYVKTNYDKVVTDRIDSISVHGQRYKKYGYSEMPIYLFGTDSRGHDIFKKAFTGLRTSLVLGVCTAAFCFIFGLCWGSISGYFGGNIDIIMERFCDILGGVPWIVIMTLAILLIGNNFFTFFLALCMTGWMGTAARTRTQFYRFKGREYILSSRTLGASDARLIFRHILPNSLGTVVTGSVLMIPSVIFSEATLAYLNLGLQGVQSFGVMLSDNQAFLSKFPNLVVFPAVIVSLMMISFNLFGNGLRDALNPSLKGTE